MWTKTKLRFINFAIRNLVETFTKNMKKRHATMKDISYRNVRFTRFPSSFGTGPDNALPQRDLVY